MIDLPGRGSNQHELQGVAELRRVLGTERRELGCRWRGFDRDGNLITTVTTSATWYNAREKQQHRAAEWRLYYPANTPMEGAEEGDLLLLTERSDLVADVPGVDLTIYVIPRESPLADRVHWVLGLERSDDGRLRQLGEFELMNRPVGASAWDVLLDLEPELTRPRDADLETRVDEEFAGFLSEPTFESFPSTQSLHDFARRHTQGDPVTLARDPDGFVDRCLALESAAFFRLERSMLERRLGCGFATADEFLDYSIRVQNRRKARRGKSVERVLETVFQAADLRFATQVRTEGKSSVDFLFPGLDEYLSRPEPADRWVMMLAAKSTTKDRWRQILAECRKLEVRHLFTLEGAISSDQQSEMAHHRVTLVMPASLHPANPPGPASKLSIHEFVERARMHNRTLTG